MTITSNDQLPKDYQCVLSIQNITEPFKADVKIEGIISSTMQVIMYPLQLIIQTQ